jgi:hypothetical protein
MGRQKERSTKKGKPKASAQVSMPPASTVPKWGRMVNSARNRLRRMMDWQFDRGLRALHATIDDIDNRKKGALKLGLSQPEVDEIVRVANDYQQVAFSTTAKIRNSSVIGLTIFILSLIAVISLVVYLWIAVFSLVPNWELRLLLVVVSLAVSGLLGWSTHQLGKKHQNGLIFWMQLAVYMLSNALIISGFEGVVRKNISEPVGFILIFGVFGAIAGSGAIIVVWLYRFTPARRLYDNVRSHVSLAAANRIIDAAIAARDRVPEHEQQKQRRHLVTILEEVITLIERELPRSRATGNNRVDKDLAMDAWRIAAHLRSSERFYLLHSEPTGVEVAKHFLELAREVRDWKTMKRVDRGPSLWERLRSVTLTTLPVLIAIALTCGTVWYAMSGPAGVNTAWQAIAKPAVVLAIVSVTLAAFKVMTEPPK